MAIPTAESLLANAYRMRADAAEFLADARSEGTPELVKEWEKLLARADQLVAQSERRIGVPHRPL